MALIKSYFNLYDKYTKQYGKNTILLMQVGAFYEVYGLLNKKTDTITRTNIKEFTGLCELSISNKTNCVHSR